MMLVPKRSQADLAPYHIRLPEAWSLTPFRSSPRATRVHGGARVCRHPAWSRSHRTSPVALLGQLRW